MLTAQNFGWAFQRFCVKRKVKPTSVCKAAELGSSTLTAWADGHWPRLQTLCLVAEYFRMRPWQFLRAIEQEIDAMMAEEAAQDEREAEEAELIEMMEDRR